ncbi:hypothetical protein KCV87_12110 [Actinosynnema pretiosum subsp. pretiosum]|uniref:Uncharacterized protein n=1 Tax=Actinosynnema pretiosum subsp. pretiosum TaxID=103721 RepID=A0AA45R670_9PSEU|nr:hypothetical protein APASM_1621 [Actinosynnema pretiosum subsp. pretiosum]QUF06722.1 hypothetical protein KCV87_12110 [Actinosynnema pretiosum subsp. pretiosum]
MPDWTYHPLRGIAAALLGERRSQRVALRFLAAVGSTPGGGRLVAEAFGHRHVPPHLAGAVAGVPVRNRLGAVVPPGVARHAVRALPLLGAGLVEVSPVGPADVPVVREAARGRRVPVVARAVGPDAAAVAAALSPHVDAIANGDDPAVLRTTCPSVTAAAHALAEPGAVVLAAPSVLIHAGPGWFARVIEAATPTCPPTPVRGVGHHPRRWPAWWWGLLVGLGMVGAGLGAAAIALGPVLLWYDRDFLGTGPEGLHAVNHRLVGFLRHDRITLAGTMVAIGALYAGLALGGLRRGWPWAREAYLVSGWICFPTLLYFLGFGFVEPLHTAVTVVLFPMFLAATRRRRERPQWTVSTEGPEHLRRRALTGQLLMVLTGVGLFVGGVVVSVVGLTDVFVASDLEFLGTSPELLEAAGPRLLPFIAHDRAGFGGALMAAAAAITLLSAWGWRRGESWVWWTLAMAAVAGFAPALFVHGAIGYTAPCHLAPVVVGVGLTAVALALSRPYLCAHPEKPRRTTRLR